MLPTRIITLCLPVLCFICFLFFFVYLVTLTEELEFEVVHELEFTSIGLPEFEVVSEYEMSSQGKGSIYT